MINESLRALAQIRWRIAIRLTALMVLVYFGFILLIAYNKPMMGRLIAPGLSLGILLGALVIGAAWVLTLIYVRWANAKYDPELERIRQGAGRKAQGAGEGGMAP
ncbi:MAG: DUF485 domain-containing protein [Gemmatimonadales bacterium]